MRDNWRKTIYIAKLKKDINGNVIIDDYGKSEYEKPKMYEFNVQPLSGSTDIMGYGQKAIQMQRAIVDYNKYFGKFEEDDLVYLDGKNPKNESINGEQANYRIDAILNQNKKISIYFEKLPVK